MGDYLRHVRIMRNVRVPMRDGVELATNVYLPREGTKFPVVLVRMAYNRAHITGGELIERGLAVVSQDTRGRYASDGKFYPFIHETNDGYDTLDWIARQPWCNGKVGMYGDSYLASVQLALAHTNHPLLTALNPRFMSADIWRQGYYCDGAFSEALTFSWLCLEVGSRTSEANLMPFFNIPMLLRERPIVDLDIKSGNRSEYYRDFATNYARNQFWRDLSYRETLPACRVPSLLTGGWYDYYPNEAFRMYADLLSGDAPEAIKRSHRVLVGPWTHGIHGRSKLGQLDFGPEATKENDHSSRWLETMLKGGTPQDYQKALIRLFVMGDNVWRDENEWPLARTQFTRYYLHSQGSANTCTGDGTLSTSPPQNESSDKFTYNPDDPCPTIGGNHSVGTYNPGLYEICLPGPYDQGPVETRPDVLCFTSPVLESDTEITGPVWVHLFASTSGRDTDFVARLCDVYPDGRSINITEGVLRGRFYERKWDAPRLLEPGAIYEFRIELQPTANVWKKGHRIRVNVTSSSFPLWEPNPNTGGDPATETRWEIAQQTIYHDAQHPSHVVLPIIPR